MGSSEDFSFPKISYSLPKFTVSPSLWRVCSYPHEDCCDGNQVSDDDDDEEEKMDMLWEEYFIQELKRVSSSIDHIVKEEAAEAAKLSDSDVCGVEVCDCMQQCLKNSSSTNTARGNSNSRWVVFIKVFKKIFFINNNLAWI